MSHFQQFGSRLFYLWGSKSTFSGQRSHRHKTAKQTAEKFSLTFSLKHSSKSPTYPRISCKNLYRSALSVDDPSSCCMVLSVAARSSSICLQRLTFVLWPACIWRSLGLQRHTGKDSGAQLDESGEKGC